MAQSTNPAKVALSTAESLVKLIRLLAQSGKSNFKQYLINSFRDELNLKSIDLKINFIYKGLFKLVSTACFSGLN